MQTTRKNCYITVFIYKFNGDTLEQNYPGGLIADLLGDWREEVIVGVPGEIRILFYNHSGQTTEKICLMQNHQYRMDVASFSVGYPVYPQLGLEENARRKYSAAKSQNDKKMGATT